MTELFKNITLEFRKQAETVFNIAMSQKNLINAAKVLDNFIKTITEEEKIEFLNFYFNLRMEEIINADNNDKW